MELDHVDFGAGPTCCSAGAALHFLRLQLRGQVVVREEHGLQLAHIRQSVICNMGSKQEGGRFHKVFQHHLSDLRLAFTSGET